MSGSALRVAYQIPMPVLISVNGKPVYRINKDVFRSTQMITSGDVPVYAASWSLDYAVPYDIVSNNITFGSLAEGYEYI
jgi:hypothetical protein